MPNISRRLLAVLAAAFLVISVSTARAGDRKFLDSDDAKERDEPQKFLPDYDKLEKGKDADCSIAFKYGMKRDFNKWLASLGPAASSAGVHGWSPP